MKSLLSVTVLVVVALMVSACQSSQDKSVTSNYRSQWTTVAADVKTTTAAAEAVLNDAGLMEVRSNATNVDGTASGKKADGTKVNVAVRKKAEATSEVSVTVGTLGDPSLGAELARKIRDRASGGSMATTRP